MTPERWQLVKEIFQQALDQPEAERPRFLAGACPNDPAMRVRIEQMLEDDARNSVMLDRNPVGVVARLLARDESDSLAGHLFAHYRLEREIGRGGMGRVYLAHDTRLDRRVALKLLPPAFSEEPERVRRFQQEARAVSALNHPNIITIHEIGESDGVRFIVTEFVEGETLGDLIARGKPDLAGVIKIMIQVSEALSAAHGAGIVHRDIKPENIMVRPDGYAKVLDFGIAKLSQSADGDAESGQAAAARQVVTTPGLVLGTVKYMSPEQARGHTVDARTDIFSLGVVLYEVVTGQSPFQGQTRADVLIAIAGEEPPPLADYVPEVALQLQPIIDQSLKKKREERYQTIREMGQDLARVDEGRSTGGRRGPLMTGSIGTGTSLSAELLVKEVKRHKLVAAATLMTIISITALVVYFRTLNASRLDSIAVIPFSYSRVNHSALAENDRDYLNDGLTEGLINSLSQLPGLKVIARSSVFRFKGQQTDPQVIAQTLAVRSILTGRIIQSGESLKVSAELVDARNSIQLWGHQYDIPVSEMSQVQRDIVGHVSEALRLQLTDEDHRRLDQRYTQSSEAYQLYLQGRYFWNKRTEADLKKSIDYYQQAIAKDQNYALAYAGLASAYASLPDYSDAPLAEAAAASRAAANHAIQLDDRLAEAYTARAKILIDRDWDWKGAEQEFKRAIEIDANYATAHHWYGLFLKDLGRFDEAAREVEKARELDPVSLSISTAVGAVSYYAHQYDRAIQQFKKALELDANAAGLHAHLGMAYEQAGRYQEAIAEFDKAASLRDGHADFRLAHTYAISGQRDKALAFIVEEQAKGNASETAGSHYARAIVYAGLGDKDAAFAALEKVVQERDPVLVSIKVDPQLDSLHADPRFERLLERLGLSR